VSNVFIIVNEWLPEGAQNSSSEVVGGVYFTDEQDAWDALQNIAESFYVTLGMSENNIVFEGDDAPEGVSFEEYYIEELAKKS
jgi:hypothetical protein